MDINQARENMLKQQIRAWGVLSPSILSLLEKIPRESFVPLAYQHLAFADTTVPIGHGQMMLTPKEEAKIIEALQIQKNERVLEIGTGSGYLTALLATQAKHVETVDIFSDFTEQAAKKLAQYNIHNVTLVTADAATGYKKNTQYDVIVISGSLPFLPKGFRHQVAKGGRLFAFIGQPPLMEALLLTYIGNEQWESKVLFETYVVPLVNTVQINSFIF